MSPALAAEYVRGDAQQRAGVGPGPVPSSAPTCEHREREHADMSAAPLRDAGRESVGVDRNRGDEIAESLALDNDVFAQSLVRQFAISGEDRGDDAIMLGERI